MLITRKANIARILEFFYLGRYFLIQMILACTYKLKVINKNVTISILYNISNDCIKTV